MTDDRPAMNAPPWKLSVLAALSIAAGVKLVFTDWPVAGLSAFVALLFVAGGTLRVVITKSFTGLAGALAALGVGGDIGVGAVLLAWPRPTLFLLLVLSGAWITARSMVDATITVTTRADHIHWLPPFFLVAAQLALGILLLSHPSGTTRAAGVIIGGAAVLQGARILGDAVAGRRRTPTSTTPPNPSVVVAVLTEP